jgi:hypothetical protein
MSRGGGAGAMPGMKTARHLSPPQNCSPGVVAAPHRAHVPVAVALTGAKPADNIGAIWAMCSDMLAPQMVPCAPRPR